MQGRNEHAYIENELVDIVGEGESSMNGESSIDKNTLPCVKQIANEKLLYNTGPSPGLCNYLEGWGRAEWGSREGGVIYIYIYIYIYIDK